MERVVVETPQILVLAEGASPQARSSARGSLFETFVALLLAQYGYEDPTKAKVNVTSHGIELDVTARHQLSGHHAIVECKAYTTNVEAGEIDKFYGKLQIERFDNSALQGLFFAIPGMTPAGNEQARTITDRDGNFKLFQASEIVELLISKGIVSANQPTEGIYADYAVVVTDAGVFSVAKEIDPGTRRPVAVRVWSKDGNSGPTPVVDLLSGSDYAADTPVLAEVDAVPPPPVNGQALSIVEVTGSSSDFEYQLPASPKFFVGRRTELTQLKSILTEAQGKVIVVNAQSGWGKSSLALRLERVVRDAKGVALIVDTRTASSPEFVWRVLSRIADIAASRGMLKLGPRAAFSSLPTSLNSIRNADWLQPDRPLLVFFDQFENVFRDPRLTQEFRDLALSVRELPVAITVAFAWKTDLIGWTEGHPYQLRDDIRGSGYVAAIGPLGPSEVSTLLRRLERDAGLSLTSELKQRLREYSQGLPWLFKKLASHILSELRAGTSQEELLAEALNVQSLFENDLAQLGPQEQEALRAIAKNAPMLASEASDLVSNDEILQSLIDQRLLVQVGERLDIYWDTFRDFLNTGRIPIQDTYILRQTPSAVSRLLRAAVDADGDMSVASAAKALKTTEGVVFNMSRDLRMMGVLAPTPGRVRMAADIREAVDPEAAVRQRISNSLRRHMAYSLLLRQIEESGGAVTTADYALALPEAFPAVEASSNTWSIYARAFAWWFVYARLVGLDRGRITLGASPDTAIELLREGLTRSRVRQVFPQSPADPAVDLARLLAGFTPAHGWSDSGFRKAVNDLVLLGLASVDSGSVTPKSIEDIFTDSGKLITSELRKRVESLPGTKQALAALEEDPRTKAASVGEILRTAYGAQWSASTTSVVGKFFRSWARVLGVKGIPRRRRRGPRSEEKGG